jgi:hypothetical protein
LSKKKLVTIIVSCVIAIIVVIVITTHLPQKTRKPEQTAVSAYNLSEQLFDPQLTSLQRDTLWEEYEGKQVKWTSELKELVLGEEGLVAYFLDPIDWGRTEIKAVFNKDKKSSLLELKKGDLIIYTGILTSFGESFGEAEINLTDCTIVSLAVIPLWWNSNIDTSNKRILVGDEVLCIGPSAYADVLQFGDPPTIITVNRETGKLLWEGKEYYRYVLIGVDSQYIYTSHFEIGGVFLGVWYWEGPYYITALDKVSGQIGWTSRSGYCPCQPFTEHPELSLSFCEYCWVSQIQGMGNETTNKGESGLTLLPGKPSLPELDYEHEGVIYKSACAVYGGTGTNCGTLQAIDQKTGSVLWMMTFQETGMTDFSIADGILYVSTDKGVGAFELPNLTYLQN